MKLRKLLKAGVALQALKLEAMKRPARLETLEEAFLRKFNEGGSQTGSVIR